MLELVKHHISEVHRVNEDNWKILKELGFENGASVCTNRFNGEIISIRFPKGKLPEGWTKPDSKGHSRPKAKTEWHKRLHAGTGYKEVVPLIRESLGIPCTIHYHGKDITLGSSGSCCMGNPFVECGFLWLSDDGPYAMWTPDIPAIVAQYEADGYTVEEPVKSYKLEFEGCRRIEKEEWEIMVLRHNLEKKGKAA